MTDGTAGTPGLRELVEQWRKAGAASPRYAGPIEVGMHFIWEPHNPHAFLHVVVTEIATRDSNGYPFDERHIYAKALSSNKFNAIGTQAWNEEGRFREACRPCDARGVLQPDPPPRATGGA